MRLGAFGSAFFALSLLAGSFVQVNQQCLAATTRGARTSTSEKSAPVSVEPTPSHFSNKATAPCDWTPMMVLPVSAPRLFRGSDDLYNLVYEVHLINYNAAPSKILSFEILDNNGRVLKSYSPAELKKVTLNLRDSKSGKSKDEKGNSFAAGASGILWLNLEFKDKESAPKELVHKIVVETDFAGKTRRFENAHYKLKVEEKSPVVVGPPLKGGRWYVAGGYAGDFGHRRSLFPQGNRLVAAQRYAIDWLLMTNDDHVFNGDGKECSQYPGYGKPIISVADGTVVGVVDKFEDQVPNHAKGDQLAFYPGGNTAVVDIGDGNYAFYAHMKPGSIKVKEGQKVKRGEVIGLLGSSGNSTAPHLHFHVMDGPSILGSQGVPYVFDNFSVKGIANEDQTIKSMDKDGRAPVVKSKFDGKHSGELPREGMLIVFPE